MFRVKKETTFQTTVTVYEPTSTGHEEFSFKANFRIVADNEIPKGKTLMDVALVSVDEVEAEEGVTAEQILQSLKSQPHTAAALRTAYSAAVVKKNMGSILSI